MTRRLRFLSGLLLACSMTLPASGQLIVNGQPNIDDDRLHSWYDALDFIGFDGIAETPLWPNKQGDLNRSVWSAFGPSEASDITFTTLDNGLPAIRYIDAVSWGNADVFGVVDDGFTVFVVASVRDENFAYLFTGNQGGGGAEANANFPAGEFEGWSMKGDGGRIETGPLVTDVLQYHAFVYGSDGIGSHFIDGDLSGAGEIGDASLQGFVLGGRQNGAERATVDFAEVLIYNEDLNDTDRQSIENYLEAKYFSTGGEPGDYDGDGLLTAADLDILSAAVRAGSTDNQFDVDGDGGVSAADHTYWIEQLKGTYVGDSNLDGEFNSGDLVFVFTAGEYEDVVAGNSGWGDGDWDGNADFDSSDFVAAFVAGGYELGPRAAAAAVPEPTSLLLGLMGLLACGKLRR